jgi:CDP-2,3-bis-(O-geranylgeranyl)-sn-glycerol synthase
MLDEFIRLILLILPAYVANAAPVVLGGHFPIDGGMRAWDKRPIFGPSKTDRKSVV